MSIPCPARSIITATTTTTTPTTTTTATTTTTTATATATATSTTITIPATITIMIMMISSSIITIISIFLDTSAVGESPSRRGQDKPGRDRGAAVPPNELSRQNAGKKCGNTWQNLTKCGNTCALQTKYNKM